MQCATSQSELVSNTFLLTHYHMANDLGSSSNHTTKNICGYPIALSPVDVPRGFRRASAVMDVHGCPPIVFIAIQGRLADPLGRLRADIFQAPKSIG